MGEGKFDVKEIESVKLGCLRRRLFAIQQMSGKNNPLAPSRIGVLDKFIKGEF